MATQEQNQKITNKEEYDKQYEEKLQNAIKQEEKSFAGFFIKHFRFTYLIIFVLIALGIFSMITLPREAEPEIKVPFIVVTTIYPGATPKDVEDLITKKIEDKIKNLENLNRYTSSSGQGFSSVFVEFTAEADLDESFRKLREKVDDAEPELPKEAESPMVTEINFNDLPIVTYSLVGDYKNEELKNYADRLQEEFENIQNVSEAPIIGGEEREFQIIVDQNKLNQYGTTLSQIISAIQSANFNLPAGDIEVDGFNYNVRIEGKFYDTTNLNDIVITTFNNSPVLIRDLALVIDGFKESDTKSRIGFLNTESKPTISIQIRKKTGGNILNIVKESEDIIANAHANNLIPDDIQVIKTNDNSVFIKNDLKTLGSSGLQTIILITIILYIVLSFRGALITASSVPLAFLASFYFLKAQDMTLNSIVLFSLVLSLGLMVDNAIVIIEGINEYISKHKKSVYEAAILSVWNFKWPVISGTMTTVSAFLPLLLVSGIMGEYMGVIPKTLAVTLLSSLFVALIIIPTLSARFIKKEAGQTHRSKKRHKFIEKNLNKLKEVYAAFLNNILPHQNKRRMLLATVWILFIISVAVPVSGLMKIEMFPRVDIDYFYVNIELPIGSVIEKTDEITAKVEKIISQMPEMENYVTNIGSAMAINPGSSGSSGSYLSSITVNLADSDNRIARSYELAENLREKLKEIQGAKITVDELSGGPPSGAPIEVRIFGDNAGQAAIATDAVKDYFGKIDGVINIKDSIENATGDFTFRIDKQKANYYGLNVATIASTLRNVIYGTKASVVNLSGDDIDITVKYNKDKITNAEDLKNILIPTNRGENIQLKEVAELELEPALLSINHRDGETVVTVSADTTKEADVQKIISNFEKEKVGLNLPENIKIGIGGETEDIEKSFREIFMSLLVAIGLIALILVLQFNSFKQPFIILFALPLALIGVILGLTILGQPFSITAFIGIVSLTGIVVNDSIILIDRINKNIKGGMNFFEGIVDGGLSRMQPIFVTSITTIVGIFPLIFANEMWVGLSLTIICGLSFSTILTLIVVPVYYASICQKEC